jgi:hypothetical protein
MASFGRLQAPVLALPLAILLLAVPATAQIVTGRVIDASNDEPLGGVTLTLLDARSETYRSFVSNDGGAFLITIAAPGTYLLRASRIGYATVESPPFGIGEGEVIEVEVLLDVEAVQLEPLTVVVRRPETQLERDLRGYFERAEAFGEPRLGATQIYTRESLQQWDAWSLEDLFRDFVRWRPRCTPKVFVDGRRRSDDLSMMSVFLIEGIELYAGSGPKSSRFWDPQGCGVILVWRRVLPETEGGLSLVEVLALAGAGVALILGAMLAF